MCPRTLLSASLAAFATLLASPAHAQPMVFGHLDSVGQTDVPSPNYRCDVAVDGHLAVLGGANNEAYLVDVSDPAHPYLRSTIVTQSFTPDVQINDTLVYLALSPGQGIYDGDAVLIVNVTNPDVPEVVGTYGHAGMTDCPALFIADTLLFAGSYDGRQLEIINVANPAQPESVGSWLYPQASTVVGAYIHDIFVRDHIAYLAYWEAGLQIIDVSNPAVPVRLGQVAIPGTTCHSLWVDANRRAYVVDLRSQFPYSVLHVIDLRDPSDAHILSSQYWCTDDPLHFISGDDRVPGVVMAAHHTCGVWALDVNTAGSSYVVDEYTHSGDHLGFWGTAFDGRYVYGAHMERGIYVFEFHWAARGDFDGDHAVDLRDVVLLINFLLRGGPPPAIASDQADWDCDGVYDILDLAAAIDYTFRGGAGPCSGL